MPHRLIGFERRILLTGLAAFAPAWAAIIVVACMTSDATYRWLLLGVSAVSIVAFYLAVRSEIDYPLRTLANLIGALREEDYSIRLRGSRGDDAMGEVSTELNRLTEALREQRLGALEAAALVRAVIAEIDSAIFAFDGEGRLQVVNRSGERLLGRNAERLLGRDASELGLAALLDGEPAETAEISLPGGSGRWLVRRSRFRDKGVPHRLLVMSDLSRALREEERLAWQRLLRVLGHELNNSLAPIRSIAMSLSDLLNRDEPPADLLDDVRSGLSVIASRTAGLTRFMEGYARLARLPRPVLRRVPIAAVVARLAGLQRRMPLVVIPGPDVAVDVDPDQIEQLLINVTGNAVDASLEAGGAEVAVTWTVAEQQVEITVSDDGAGISATANLFVPFFTTKTGGSGVGLALSRHIAEAHGGTLTLENRATAPGAIARLRLPR
jgi:two-component system, NtrC family, nitrogen regulation sensor histidine kinase NtrY